MQTAETPDSLTGLVRNVGADLLEIVKAELALAKHELRDDLRDLRTSAVALGGAAVLAFAGVELVLGSLIAGSRRRPSILAALGVACLGGAFTLSRRATKNMPPILERTRQLAEEAARVTTGSESAGSESTGSESAGSESAGSKSTGSKSTGSESAGSES